MLFKNKKCSKCGSSYDEAISECPHCQTPNENIENSKINRTLLWLPKFKQLALFLVGCLGLLIIMELMAIIFRNVGTNEQYSALINFGSYGVLLIALLGVLYTSYKEFLKQFKNWTNYVYGIAFGVTLIAATVFWNIIVGAFQTVSNNANENAANSLILTYPLPSLIILGLIGPLCEELTYRVGLFTFLKRVNKWLPYILSALVFGFLHFDFANISSLNEWLNLPSYMITGLILGYSYDKKGLACSFTAHAFNNILAIVLTLVGL